MHHEGCPGRTQAHPWWVWRVQGHDVPYPGKPCSRRRILPAGTRVYVAAIPGVALEDVSALCARLKREGAPLPTREREFFIDNLLVRIHFIIVMVWWTGLAPWEFEFPFPGSLTPYIYLPRSQVVSTQRANLPQHSHIRPRPSQRMHETPRKHTPPPYHPECIPTKSSTHKLRSRRSRSQERIVRP